MDKTKINWNKTADPAYEARIKAAIEQYFGRKRPPKRTAPPSVRKQGRSVAKGGFFENRGLEGII